MAHNPQRQAAMQRRSVYQLKAMVDAGSLSSAAAAHELKVRGVVYTKRDPQ